jgi:hypothetical protein
MKKLLILVALGFVLVWAWSPVSATVPGARCVQSTNFKCKDGEPGGADHTCDANATFTACIRPGAVTSRCSGNTFVIDVCVGATGSICDNTTPLPCGVKDQYTCMNDPLTGCQAVFTAVGTQPCTMMVCH